MSVYLASLNSGSNGNCYYVGNATDAVLVDAGISCREINKRMRRLGLSMEKVRAIFISHEHSDHIRGVEVTSRSFNLPVYINEATLKNSRLDLNPELVRSFEGYGPIPFGDLQVIAFPKSHDAADPYSFIVEHKGVNVGVLTDIGHNCEDVIKNFGKCHAAFLEANYDEQMLEEGGYPFYLKKRIRSEKGHLSNDQSLELFRNHRHENLSLLLLSHLSQHNNSPQVASDLFAPHADSTTIEVASRYKETGVYELKDGIYVKPAPKPEFVQTALF